MFFRPGTLVATTFHVCHLSCLLLLFLRNSKLSWLQNPLLSYAMANITTQKMIGQLIKLFNSLDMCSNNSFFFFEYPYISINFHICKLLVFEVSEGGGDLIFTFMIKENIESTGVIIYFELCTHWFFYAPENTAT